MNPIILTTPFQVYMTPKSDIVYSMGRSKFVAPSPLMIGTFDDEKDPEYVPPGINTLTPAERATQGTPQKVVSDVVTASQSDESAL